jgi:hypothetical protein
VIFRFFLPVERQVILSLAFIGGAGHQRAAPRAGAPAASLRSAAITGDPRCPHVARAAPPGPLVLARQAVTATCRMISSRQESRTNPVYLFGADVT